LGSDFDGFTHGPQGLRGCQDYPQVVALLAERGYAQAELRKIAWDNWQRVFSTTFP